MNSVIYTGKISHVRKKPRSNTFVYSVYMAFIDLDELPVLNKKLKFFSHNRFNVLSFYDEDHFKFIHQKEAGKQLIAQENVNYHSDKYLNLDTKTRIGVLLKEAGFDFEPGKVFALTNLRVFGYVFNPVTFYYCFDKEGVFRVLASEVNNTYGDQKMYFVPIKDPKAKIFTSFQRKNYYISPYTSFDNDLTWRFGLPDEKILMIIESLEGGETEINATFAGEKREMTDWRILFLNLRYPLFTLMVIFRIYFQALKLYLKKIKFRDKQETDKEIIQTIKKN